MTSHTTTPAEPVLDPYTSPLIIGDTVQYEGSIHKVRGLHFTVFGYQHHHVDAPGYNLRDDCGNVLIGARRSSLRREG